MVVGKGAVWRDQFSERILYSRGGHATLNLGMGAAGGGGE
jgi:hypothetical protein